MFPPLLILIETTGFVFGLAGIGICVALFILSRW